MSAQDLRVAGNGEAGEEAEPAAVSRMTPTGMRFAHKVSLLMIAVIGVTGLSITSVTAFRFRHEMYQQEFSAAFTVYRAAGDYLVGHFKANRYHFVPKSLEFVLKNKFLREPAGQPGMVTHRPSNLVLYDAHGRVIYEYPAKHATRVARDIHPSQLPLKMGPEYDSDNQVIRIAGPISPEGDVPGFVDISIPTRIREQVRTLFVQSFLTMLAVVVLAVALSWVFARRVLAPIEALTRAAQRVHRGDLDQHVEVATDDEIGVLAGTFNEMVASLARRIALLHRLQEWTVKIGKELESQRLYGTLVAMFCLIARSQSCRLYVYDKKNERLEAGTARSPERLPPPDDDRISQMAFEERWSQYLRADGTIGSEPAGAVEVAIPLLSGEHRIGVIRMGRSQDGSPYDDETLTILLTLAQHASVAIDNAHLYTELAEKQRIEQEMRWARDIQQSLLPRHTPALPGYDVHGTSLPAFEVGGDYFDYIQSDGNLWHFVIGDVSGKGVPAALIMSIIRSLIRTYVEIERSPGDVLIKVNRRLSGDLEPDMFVTLATATLDPRRHALTVARAGHEPILLRRANGEIEHISPEGVALGIMDADGFESRLQTRQLALQENDTLLFYTDGITEARNADQDEFGIERLDQILKEHGHLPAREVFDKVIGAIRDFSAGAAQSDDITLIVLRRVGAS